MRQTKRWMDSWVDRWTGGQMDKWMGGWTDALTDKQTTTDCLRQQSTGQSLSPEISQFMNCDVTDRTVGVLTCREGHIPDNCRVTTQGMEKLNPM